MNVANRELCQDLYELSGWDKTGKWYHDDIDGSRIQVAPKYDLGYLLQRLPYTYMGRGDAKGFLTVSMGNISAVASYKPLYSDNLVFFRDKTPEDAACKLAIELFNQGILTKEAQS